MNKQSFILLFSLSFITFGTVYSQVAKESIKVLGNCGMCKKVIEKAAQRAGATAAEWNKDSKILSVSYNSAKTSNGKIQTEIAASGYDTQDYTASSEAYSNLPGCCKYDRKESTTSVQSESKEVRHECSKDGCEKCAKEKASKACDEKCGKECKDGCKDMAACKSKDCAKKS
jgi:hypothetical protein